MREQHARYEGRVGVVAGTSVALISAGSALAAVPFFIAAPLRQAPVRGAARPGAAGLRRRACTERGDGSGASARAIATVLAVAERLAQAPVGGPDGPVRLRPRCSSGIARWCAAHLREVWRDGHERGVVSRVAPCSA
jgi:hypothetical protein